MTRLVCAQCVGWYCIVTTNRLQENSLLCLLKAADDGLNTNDTVKYSFFLKIKIINIIRPASYYDKSSALALVLNAKQNMKIEALSALIVIVIG